MGDAAHRSYNPDNNTYIYIAQIPYRNVQMCITIKRKDYVMIIIKNNLSRIKIKYNKTVTIVITI